MESVALVHVQQDLLQSLEQGLDLIGGFDTLVSPVIIKPNICTISDNTGYSVTHSLVIEALLNIIFQKDPDISVRIVESDSQSKWAKDAFRKFGYTELVIEYQKKHHDIDLINLSECSTETIPFDGDYFTNPELPDVLVNLGSVISVAQAKTHYLTSITGVLKNLFGCLPRKDQRYYHPNINEVIADLSRLIPIDLGVVDARVGVLGWNGPQTKPLDKFILGHKPVSVDATLAHLMEKDPLQIQHLVQCQKYGLGTIFPQILSDTGSDQNDGAN